MSEEKRQINVLNFSKNELPDFLMKFLENFDFNIVDTYDESVKYQIIIAKNIDQVEDAAIDAESLVIVFEISSLNLSKTSNIININLLKHSIAQKLARRFIEDDTSIHVEQEFNEGVEHFDSFKITDQLQTGYYTDLVTMTSLNKGFDFISIRLYLTYLMTFFSYLKQANQISLPIDFDLIGDESTFMIQANCNATNFQLDSLKEAFSNQSMKNPALGLIQGSVEYTHLVDFYYIKKTSKLVVSSLWVNADDILAPSQGSFFKIFNQLSGSVGKNTESNEKKILAQATSSEESLPGDGYSNVEQPSEVNNDNSAIDLKIVMAGDLNKMVDYIKSENETGIVTYKKESFDTEMVGWFLSGYNDQRLVGMLVGKNLEYIIHCLKDSNYLGKIKEKVTSKDTAGIAVNVAETIKRNLKDDTFINDLNEKRADEGKDELDVKSIADEIAEEINEGKEDFKTIEDIQDKTKELVSEKLEIKDEEVQELVDKIMLESIQDYIDALEKTGDDGAKVDKKYVVKMMKVIQGLKNKIIEMQGEDSEAEVIELAELRSKVSAHDSLIEVKEKVIKELHHKVDQLQSNKPVARDGEEVDESESLKAQIRSMESQLELYQERVSVLSDKLDKNGDKSGLLFNNSKTEVPNSETSKTSDLAIKSKITNLEKEKAKIETRMKKLEDHKNREISKLREEVNLMKKDNSNKKYEAKIIELKRENKRAIDEAKGMILQVKNFQQKLKTSQKQVERLQKHKSPTPTASTAGAPKSAKGGIDPKSAHKIKLLEASNAKAQLQSKKVEKELLARKAELSKLKGEVGLQKNKIDELTRKLLKHNNAA